MKELRMRKITTASLLLSFAVCALPASASYFFNSEWGTMLNVGSAPNPTPDQLRAIGDSKRLTAAAPAPAQPAARDVAREVVAAPTVVQAESKPAAPIVATRVSPKEEKRVTVQLNRAQLIRARVISAETRATKVVKATANKKSPVKANKAFSNASPAKAKAASVKTVPWVKAASSAKAGRPRAIVTSNNQD
jgi:hypothetical protein